MSAVVYKPPVAPKPKLSHDETLVLLSSSIHHSNGHYSPLHPSTPRSKPALAPKPCLSKLSPAVESKPLILKDLQHTAISPPVTLLCPQIVNQQENKKPDWDYIIPICLCSQENCTCIRTSPPNLKRIERDLKGAYIENNVVERSNIHPASQRFSENIRFKDTGSTNTQPFGHKAPQNPPRGLHINTDTLAPDVAAKPALCLRSLRDEVNANLPPPSDPHWGPQKDALMPQAKLVPVSLKNPVPVPRKLSTSVLTNQEKIEKKVESSSQKGREINVKEVKKSSERRSCSSMPVKLPVSENQMPTFTSARKVSAPPAPPPRKRPFLSELETSPTSASQVFPKGAVEANPDSDSCSYAMEVSGDDGKEEVHRKGMADENRGDEDLTHRPPSVNLPTMPSVLPVITIAPVDDIVAKVVPKKPQRLSGLQATVQKMDLPAEKDLEQLGEGDNKKSPAHKDRTMKEMPRPPKDKSRKSSLTPSALKPPRSNLTKQKSKSFSASDFIRSDGQRRNSFRRLLDLKLSVPKMLPKLTALRSQCPDSNQDERRNLQDNLSRPKRKLSCPLIGLEQSVDGIAFSPGPEEESYYENISHYEEIADYENVCVGKSVLLPASSYLQPTSWTSSLYNDEGIYEEQEPYMSLVKNTCLTPSCMSSGEEEAFENEGTHSDNDITANSSDDEDDEDSSTSSSKGNPESPEECEDQKKTKIHHIATEIMSSEKVFVDVLQLLHVDFRDSVSQASRQSGKPVIEERLLNQILYYLPQLYELNQDLLRELKHRVAKWDENAHLADIFLKKGPFLKMYSTYIREFDKNVALLDEQVKRNPTFGAVLRTFEASPRCANLALKHYLLKPVQRIPQYQLLLTDYLKNLSEESADYKDTQAALALVKEVANHANDIMKQGDNFQKLIQVQCRLNGQHEIVQPGRIFLKEGILMKLSRKVMQPRMFFLFNDTLLYTTPVQSGQFKLNNMLPLAGMKVSRPSHEAYQNELNIESVQRSFILSASSATERDEWLQAILTAISNHIKKKFSFVSGKPLLEVQIDSDGSGAPLGSKAPIWIPDLRTTMCMICTCEFSVTWRRHHCRACGKVVCQTCSSNKHGLEYLEKQVARVCDQCFLILQQETSERALETAVSPASKASFAFNRKQKKIPAALKEVSANTDNSSMSGYLIRSKSNKKQGKRLWFVIKDKVLYTYAASEDVAALESQPLLGFLLKVDPSQTLFFQLYHKDTLYYIFKADDIQTTQRWVDSFNEATVL